MAGVKTGLHHHDAAAGKPDLERLAGHRLAGLHHLHGHELLRGGLTSFFFQAKKCGRTTHARGRTPPRTARSCSAPPPTRATSPTLHACASSCPHTEAARVYLQDGVGVSLTKHSCDISHGCPSLSVRSLGQPRLTVNGLGGLGLLLALRRDGVHGRLDLFLVAKIIMLERPQRGVQLVDQRDAGRDVQPDDLLVRDIVQDTSPAPAGCCRARR